MIRIALRYLQDINTQNYTEKFYDPDNQDGVITHLEPDILECNVK